MAVSKVRNVFNRYEYSDMPDTLLGFKEWFENTVIAQVPEHCREAASISVETEYEAAEVWGSGAGAAYIEVYYQIAKTPLEIEKEEEAQKEILQRQIEDTEAHLARLREQAVP